MSEPLADGHYGRDAIARAGKHDVSDYDAMLAGVLGTGSLSTEDERFLSYSAADMTLPITGQATVSVAVAYSSANPRLQTISMGSLQMDQVGAPEPSSKFR